MVCFGFIHVPNFDLPPGHYCSCPHLVMWVLCTAPPLLHSLVHGHPSNWRSLYGLPSPWLLLPLATIAAAVVEMKKLLLAPTLTMKAACEFAVCRAVTDIIVWVVCVCVQLIVFLWFKKNNPAACWLAGWLAESVMGGALLISLLLEKVTRSQHCSPQLREHDK